MATDCSFKRTDSASHMHAALYAWPYHSVPMLTRIKHPPRSTNIAASTTLSRTSQRTLEVVVWDRIRMTSCSVRLERAPQ
jgi:hypothetical protein